jgi:hypothetical protein
MHKAHKFWGCSEYKGCHSKGHVCKVQQETKMTSHCMLSTPVTSLIEKFHSDGNVLDHVELNIFNKMVNPSQLQFLDS